MNLLVQACARVEKHAVYREYAGEVLGSRCQ